MGKAAAHGIDAEGKEAVEILMRRPHAQSLARDQVPVECFKVADIEDNAVAFRNGTVIQRRRDHPLEQVIRHRRDSAMRSASR